MPRGVAMKLKKTKQNHNLLKVRQILQYQKGKRQNEVIERVHKIF